MELIYLQTFREVAVRQSFTRAAEELGYAQSSVTMQIQRLEKAYEVKLFERYGRGLRLTSAGEEPLKVAIQMLDLYQESKEKLAKQGGGLFRSERLIHWLHIFSHLGFSTFDSNTLI